MTTKTWNFDLDGFKHTVVLEHGYFSGKRKIRVDGTLVEESKKLFDMGSDHVFTVAGHSCSIHIRTNWVTFFYDLAIDGISVTNRMPVEFLEQPNDPRLAASPAALQTLLKTQRQLKGAASWFYVIAALSVVNSIIYIFNGNISFVVGLGITQVIDGIAAGISEIADPSLMPLIRTIGLVLNLAIAGGFVGFGVLTNKKHRWALITGMVLYGLDMILLILALDVLSILFHGMAIVGLASGLTALKQLSHIDNPTQAVPILK